MRAERLGVAGAQEAVVALAAAARVAERRATRARARPAGRAPRPR